MAITSKTGLMPSAKKNLKAEFRRRTPTLEAPDLAVPAPFVLRPFAGIYNPFPYGCSILCNHPTDFEAKAIAQKAKDTWIEDGKSLAPDYAERLDCSRAKEIQQPGIELTGRREKDKVFRELFRQSTACRSRPLTPAPTLASLATNRASASLRNRRCLTPDPTSFIPTKEKTFLVLDLRRSHSQEIVSWPREERFSEANFDANVLEDENDSRPASPPSQIASESKKKTPRKKSVASSGTNSSLKSQSSKESKNSKNQNRRSSSSPKTKTSAPVDREDKEKVGQVRRESPGGRDATEIVIIKRRGKKRREKKSGMDRSRGDKEVKGIPDPGETQVSTMGDESKEGSSRQSVSGEEIPPENREANPSAGIFKSNLSLDRGEEESFLGCEILRRLQRQLDQEVVDLEMNIKRKKALEEALRHKSNWKCVRFGEEMKFLRAKFEPADKKSEKWTSTPRVFTRRSVRFELPMDSRLLNEMTPLEYVQNYAFPSSARLVLYNQVFNLCKQEVEDEEEEENNDEESERTLSGKKVLEGLCKIMGRRMTAEEGEEFQSLLGWSEESDLNFRTFAGIAAACERILGPRSSSKMPGQREDPRHEIESADFEKLECKLKRLKPDRRLVEVLRSIRDF